MSLDLLNGSNAVWAWFGIGAVLLMLEIALPGVFLLWFGFAALMVGGVLMLTALDPMQQVGAFAFLSVVLVLFAREVLRYGVTVSDRSVLNRAGSRFTGQVVQVEEPIVNGRGKVKVGDTLWNAEGPDAPIGARVKVTGSKGTVLTVCAA